jgi:hypothetical protein
LRIKVPSDVTVVQATGTATSRVFGTNDTGRKERIMPRLELGAVRATMRAALRRLDTWTLETLNSPAGGRRPRL